MIGRGMKNQNKNNYRAQKNEKKDGEVTIVDSPNKKNRSKNIGDYIDFEDVD
jgi:hypothetical protein